MSERVTGCTLLFNFGYVINPEEFTNPEFRDFPPPVVGDDRVFRSNRVTVVYQRDCFLDDDFADVNLVLDHNQGVVASTKRGTLEILRKADGIHFQASSTSKRFDVLFQKRQINGASAEANILQSKWALHKDGLLCVVLQAKLAHIGIALKPDVPRGGVDSHKILKVVA